MCNQFSVKLFTISFIKISFSFLNSSFNTPYLQTSLHYYQRGRCLPHHRVNSYFFNQYPWEPINTVLNVNLAILLKPYINNNVNNCARQGLFLEQHRHDLFFIGSKIISFSVLFVSITQSRFTIFVQQTTRTIVLSFLPKLLFVLIKPFDHGEFPL